MKLKKLLVIGIIIIFTIAAFTTSNIFLTEKIEADWLIIGQMTALGACCILYAQRDCPENVQKMCYWDCYTFGNCDYY